MKYFLIFFLFFNFSYATEFVGEFKQGSFILGKTDPGSKVTVDKKKVRVTKEGYFAFGLDRDRKNNIIIKIVNKESSKILEKKYLKEITKFKELTVFHQNR